MGLLSSIGKKHVFFVTVRQMGIKGIHTLAAPPLIGQERSRNMPTPLQHEDRLASKVMYRGSAADFLVLQGFCANQEFPPQMPQKAFFFVSLKADGP